MKLSCLFLTISQQPLPYILPYKLKLEKLFLPSRPGINSGLIAEVILR